MKNKFVMCLMGVLAVASMITAGVVAPSSVSAVKCPAGTKNANADMDSIAKCNMDTTQTANNDVWGTVNGIINVVLAVMGIIAVVVIIFGGFKFMTSAGDAGKVKSGRDTILYGIIGLVVALLAAAIVNFVLGAVFGQK